MSADVANYTNSYLESLGVTQQFTNIDELYQYFCVERTGVGYNDSNMQNILCNNDRRNLNYTGDDTDMYAPLPAEYFAPRTCNQQSSSSHSTRLNSLIPTLTHELIPTLTHELIPTLTHGLIPTLTHELILTLTRTHSHTHSRTHSHTHLLMSLL